MTNNQSNELRDKYDLANKVFEVLSKNIPTKSRKVAEENLLEAGSYIEAYCKERERQARIEELRNIKLKKYDDGYIAIVSTMNEGQFTEHDVRIEQLQSEHNKEIGE